jgi:hypothetical protein
VFGSRGYLHLLKAGSKAKIVNGESKFYRILGSMFWLFRNFNSAGGVAQYGEWVKTAYVPASPEIITVCRREDPGGTASQA